MVMLYGIGVLVVLGLLMLGVLIWLDCRADAIREAEEKQKRVREEAARQAAEDARVRARLSDSLRTYQTPARSAAQFKQPTTSRVTQHKRDVEDEEIIYPYEPQSFTGYVAATMVDAPTSGRYSDDSWTSSRSDCTPSRDDSWTGSSSSYSSSCSSDSGSSSSYD